MSVDIRPDDEGDNIEEWDPGLLRQELLRESQGQGRGDPADFHDSHESRPDGGSDLVPSSSASDDSHGHKINRILNRSNLVSLVQHHSINVTDVA